MIRPSGFLKQQDSLQSEFHLVFKDLEKGARAGTSFSGDAAVGSQWTAFSAELAEAECQEHKIESREDAREDLFDRHPFDLDRGGAGGPREREAGQGDDLYLFLLSRRLASARESAKAPAIVAAGGAEV
jgi:hypothetical protein